MVQVLHRTPQQPKRSYGQEILDTMGQASKAYSQHQEKQLQQQNMQKENEAAKKLGLDFTGITDPKTKQVMYSAALQGQNARQLEEQKQSAKLKSSELQLRQLEKDRGLEEGSLQSYINDLSMAERVSRPTKPEKKTQASQPIDPEQLSIIKKVRETEEYKNATPLKKYQILTGNNVSKENAQAEADIAAQEVKLSAEEKKEKRKEELTFHKDTQKFDEDLIKNTKTAKKQLETVKDIDKALKSGKVGPTSITNVLKAFGDVGERLSKAVTSKDEATLMASIPALLEGWKEVFGVRLSDADLKVLQDKLPDIGKNIEANRAILKIMKKYGESTLLRADIAADIKEKNKGLRPLGYAEAIEKRFDEMTKDVELISPVSGKAIYVPAYKVSDAIKAGAYLASEELKPGTVK